MQMVKLNQKITFFSGLLLGTKLLTVTCYPASTRRQKPRTGRLWLSTLIIFSWRMH
jgi:hypothetical protein